MSGTKLAELVFKMTKTLEVTFMPSRNARLEKLLTTASNERESLNITLVYEDAATRKWARDTFEWMEKIAEPSKLRATWWNLNDLHAPGVLAGAVSTTLRADFIIVANRSAGALPLPFYVWVNAWLPHRFQRSGAIVHLLGENSGADSENAGSYLREVARKGRMEFLLQRHGLPSAAIKLNWFETLTHFNIPIAMLN
jgi:hypothetical protein